MSAEIIKKNITRILTQRSWTINDLEKKAGTSRQGIDGWCCTRMLLLGCCGSS